MAGKKISQLSSSLAPSLTGVTVVEQTGVTYKTTLQSLRTVLVDSGSHSITGSVTASAFVGDGSKLTNLPLSHLTTTSSFNTFTSSVNNFSSSFDTRIKNATNEQILDGFAITGSNLFKGSQIISGSLIVGTGSLHIDNPEILHVENSGSYNLAHLQANNDYYVQLNLKNTSSSNRASADIVVTADNGTEQVHFIDMGINSSTYNDGFVGYENDAYLINVGKDLYVGTVGGVYHPSSLKLFALNNWENPQITISGSKQIMFNTSSVSEGFQYEFSGSVKLDNDLKVDGYVETGLIQGTGSLTLQPDVNDSRTIEIYNTSPSDIHIRGNAAYTFLGDDTTYVKIDENSQNININGYNGIYANGVVFTNILHNNNEDLNIISENFNNIGLWAEGGTVNITGSLNVNNSLNVNGVIDAQGHNINANGGNIEGFNFNVNGLLNLGSTTEKITPINLENQNAIVGHGYMTSAILYVTNIVDDLFIDLGDVPEDDNKALGFTVIVEQGGTAYSITQFRINFNYQSISWFGGNQPDVVANSINVFSFSLLKINGTWKVFGHLTTF